MRPTRIVGALVLAGAVSYVTLAAYSLNGMSTPHLVVCASDGPVGYVPTALCRWYLLEQRLGPEAVAEIEAVGGADFLLNVDTAVGYQITDAFLAAGLDVDAPAGGPGGATPLQAAVLYGDIERVEYLLARGADVHAATDRLALPPLQLARRLAAEGKLKEPAVLDVLRAAVDTPAF